MRWERFSNPQSEWKASSHFSRERFGGGEEGERGAHEALLAHERRLTPGTVVRVYRGRQEGLTGVHRVRRRVVHLQDVRVRPEPAREAALDAARFRP